LPLSKLSKEHVIPQSRGGLTDWDNIVMACFACNTKKANRTPEQAGMPLLSVPRKPKELPLVGPAIDRTNAPVEWLPYLSVA
jgi:5-methylcytosine-specific restriction endonuclease McrA